MPEPDAPIIEPVQDDAVSAVKVGLGMWLAAGVVGLLLRGQLEARGAQWWILVCGVGLISGTMMLVLFTRRAARIRTRAALAGGPGVRADARPGVRRGDVALARRDSAGALSARLVGAAWAALVLMGTAASGAAAAVGTPVVDVEDRVLCAMDVDALGEISGITSSQQHEDIVWVTNDSGGGPYLYAVDTGDCQVRATLTLLDTPARDHEALAWGRDDRGRAVIWVADIGDNRDSWPYARIHKVLEPEVVEDASVPVTTYRFTYPGGPVNAEALMAAPDREQLWVISKEGGVGEVFELPSPMSDARTPMRASSVGAARALITDAAMSPDGDRYVVRDYLSAEVFTGEPPGQAEARFRLPIQPQGEAITWTADGRRLLVASEQSGELVEVAVPSTALGTDSGIAAALPRVAGFDIYPYARLLAVGAVGLGVLVLLRRATRRRP